MVRGLGGCEVRGRMERRYGGGGGGVARGGVVRAPHVDLRPCGPSSLGLSAALLS